MTSWTEIYGRQARDLRSSLEVGPVVLSGVPGSGRLELAIETASDRRVLQLQPAVAGTAPALGQDAAREVLRLLAGNGTGDGGDEGFESRVANAFGVRAPDALALARGRPEAELAFGDIVDGIPSDACVIVRDSHVLAAPWAERALWTLRSRWQRGYSPWLVLLTRPWHIEAVSGRDAPFFGFARTVQLSAPGLAGWTAASRAEVPPEELAWLLQQTRGVPRPTLAVLDRLGDGGLDVPSAWARHVAARQFAAVWAERLARALHPFGPRLIGAIASDRPVYPAVPGARTDAIAAALRTLRDHDLILQPTKRRWVVADPALVPHLSARFATVIGQQEFL